ncbi:Uncharacterised protein [Klebsiella pneumoniae]|nr:Uncharacterised protein [Klebsiella pneumoniae]STU33248.1 Uncharacterised protein [Klebsiella pneumoniae]
MFIVKTIKSFQRFVVFLLPLLQAAITSLSLNIFFKQCIIFLLCLFTLCRIFTVFNRLFCYLKFCLFRHAQVVILNSILPALCAPTAADAVLFPVRPPVSPADTVASVLIVCFCSSLRSDSFTPGYSIPIALAASSPVAAPAAPAATLLLCIAATAPPRMA